MSNEQALLNCTFGWGKTCSLYDDSIEIAGKSYDLRDLTSIHPSYRSFFGVSSARLELSFGLHRLVLRGIADLETAHQIVSHLQPYCSTAPQVAHTRLKSSRGRTLARAQAKAWERTNKLPAVLNASSGSASRATETPGASQHVPAPAQESTFVEEPPTDEPLSLAALPKAPLTDRSLTPGETLEAFVRIAHNLSTYASPLPTMLWQPPHTPRLQPPLHSIHLIPPHQKFDSCSMPVPVVKSSVLPVIHVPVRLQYGEYAHYSIGAALCSDRISRAVGATYPPVDQGLLILTNRRVLYLGKRCQFTLAYTHLWYVSLLRSAIALHIERQFRRIIIELEHPREWASRVELLSFIARRSRPRPEAPTLAVPTLPNLDATAKHRARRSLVAQEPTLADNPTLPLLSERIESKIVEATTSEIDEPAAQACADYTTLDLPATEEAETAAVSVTDQPANASELPEDVPTQELSARSDVTTLVTQEITPAEDALTQEFASSSEEDAPTQETTAPALLEDAPTQEMRCQTVEAGTTMRAFVLVDEDDEQTIHLRERRLCQVQTISLRGRTANRPSPLAINPRALRRRR